MNDKKKEGSSGKEEVKGWLEYREQQEVILKFYQFYGARVRGDAVRDREKDEQCCCREEKKKKGLHYRINGGV